MLRPRSVLGPDVHGTHLQLRGSRTLLSPPCVQYLGFWVAFLSAAWCTNDSLTHGERVAKHEHRVNKFLQYTYAYLPVRSQLHVRRDLGTPWLLEGHLVVGCRDLIRASQAWRLGAPRPHTSVDTSV